MSKVLRIKQVIEHTGLSRSSIYAKVKDGTFPTQVHLGERAVGWLSTDVEQWIHGLTNEHSKTGVRKNVQIHTLGGQ